MNDDEMLASLQGLVSFLTEHKKVEYTKIVYMLIGDNQKMFNLLKEKGHDFNAETGTDNTGTSES